MSGLNSTPEKFVTWSDRYSVGVARLDIEHQRLVELINELYAAVTAGKGEAVVGKVLGGLASYTLTHFATEEGLLRTHKYPDLERHKAEHERLVAQLQRLQKDFRAGHADMAKELMTFLQRWLIGHILSFDKRYMAHLNAAGVK